MTDAALRALAEAAGVAPHWRDAFGIEHDVAPPTLRAVLAAIGLPASNDAEIADSAARLAAEQAAPGLPALRVVDAGAPIDLPLAPGRYRVLHESGAIAEGIAEENGSGCLLPAIAEAGYHQVEIDGRSLALAVAPRRALSPAELGAGARSFGLAVQLYGLRRRGDGGIGDFAALRDFVMEAGRAGAAAVAISPVHAQFSADPDRFSPYAPSSRVALNVLHADADALAAPDPAEAALEALDLIDWPAASRARLARFRRAFAALKRAPAALRAEFATFAARPEIAAHARFEALHGHFFAADPALWHWRNWPEPYRDPRGRAVAGFARDHAKEVAFHAFLQFLAARGLAAAQDAARTAGMPIGLIADLAVGTDSGGSHAWSRQDETLIRLKIGAPPDPLGPRGQDWGLTAFSPRGLMQSGYAALREMLGAALRHAGGVRIDHVMGLARLWVIPEGEAATEGAYLRFPADDLLRLVSLESHRHRAIILGEDLGTLPDGFRERLAGRGIMGLSVLWFERDGERFRPPRDWPAGAVAMTSTHDLPTLAGWWAGRDLDWRARLAQLDDLHAAYGGRADERARLWQAFRESGAATGDPPPSEAPAPAVDAAIRHVATGAATLVMLPLEDALGEIEQPNLPGTAREHPNWRRRTRASGATLLDAPPVTARLANLRER